MKPMTPIRLQEDSRTLRRRGVSDHRAFSRVQPDDVGSIGAEKTSEAHIKNQSASPSIGFLKTLAITAFTWIFSFAGITVIVMIALGDSNLFRQLSRPLVMIPLISIFLIAV